MKSILPLILLSAYMPNASAIPISKGQNAMHKALYTSVLHQQANAGYANKTTGVQKRLIANSYVLNGTLTDSNHYYYANGRGSAHSDPTSYYDEFYITAIDPVHNILSDSSVNWHLYSGTWYYTGTRSYSYDGTNRISKMLSRSYSYISSFVPSYNTAGKMDTIVMADTMSVVPAVNPQSRMYIMYDAQNRRVKDQNNKINGTPITKREYTYDPNGNRVRFDSYEYDTTTSGWALTYRNLNTYDVNNRLITTISELDFGMGNGLEMINKDSFSYSGSSQQPNYHVDYTWDNNLNDWVADEIIYNQYNTAGLLDTYYIIRYTTQWDTIERDVHRYDSNNLLLFSNGYTYSGNGQFSTTPYDQSTQYYEDYFPAAINYVKDNQQDISIYPNPANSIIHVETNIGSSHNISIYDMRGQIIYNNEKINTDRIEINTNNFPTGCYIISVTSDEGYSIQKQFVKQ